MRLTSGTKPIRWSLAIIGLLPCALAMALFVIGCDGSEGADAGGTSAPAVRLGYFPNLTHAQAVLGVASGDFERAVAPGKFTTRTFNAGPSLIEALFAGEIDVGYIGPGPALGGHSQSRGQGIRVIAGAAANGVAIVARKDAGITSLADLKGKRVATPQHGNTQDISARHYLSSVLKQDNLNNVLPVANAEQSALMASGQIDASWAPEPWAARLIAENEAILIAEEKDLWPSNQFGLTYVVTTPEFLAQYPDVVDRLLQVHVEWTERLQNEPDKYLPQLSDALTALTGKKLPPGVMPAAMARVKFVDEPDPQTFQTYAEWAFELGLARQRGDAGTLIDRSAFDRVRRTAASSTTTAPAAPESSREETAP